MDNHKLSRIDIPTSKIQSNILQLQHKMPSVVRNSMLRNYAMSTNKDQNVITSLVRKSKLIIGKNCKLCEARYEQSEMDCVSDCGHQFCINCLHGYFSYKLGVMQDLICPQEECEKEMDSNGTCYARMPEEFKQKYQKLMLWKQTISNPNNRLCPQQKCDGLIDLTAPALICQKCKTQFCPQCQLQKHQGPCDINFQNNFANWKRCPACRMFIQKNQGCNHITCLCGSQFCYICLSVWSNKHYICSDDNIVIDAYNRDGAEVQGMSQCTRKLLLVLMIVFFPLVCLLGLVVAVLFIIAAGVVGIFLYPGQLRRGNLRNMPICIFCLLLPIWMVAGLFILVAFSFIWVVNKYGQYVIRYCAFIGMLRHAQQPESNIFDDRVLE